MGLRIEVTVNKKSISSEVFDSDDIGEINKFLKKGHLSVAREGLTEEQRIGFDKKPRVRVDNKWDVPEEQVKPFGKIEYYARQDLSEAILYTYRAIDRRSPAVTGTYRSANYVYHNRTLVAKDIFSLAAWLKKTPLKEGSYIRFVNVTPYGARAELRGEQRSIAGKTKGQNVYKVRAKKPQGTYALAARAARNKYKATVNLLKFEWVGPSSGLAIPSSVNGRTFRTTYHPKNKDGRTGKYVYPSIKFVVSGRGIQ